MQSKTQSLVATGLWSALSTFGFVGLLGVSTTSCATSAPLQTEASTSGIRAAEEVGAADLPRAALHLQLAKEQLAKAQALAKDGEGERADSMLQRAEADAELAVVLCHGDTAKTEAEEAVERVRALRKANK